VLRGGEAWPTCLALPDATSRYLTLPHATSRYLALPRATSPYLTLPHATSPRARRASSPHAPISAAPEVFAEFLAGVLNDLMYLFKVGARGGPGQGAGVGTGYVFETKVVFKLSVTDGGMGGSKGVLQRGNTARVPLKPACTYLVW
jgi:hypothetical protein